jgi:hypothetical protein
MFPKPAAKATKKHPGQFRSGSDHPRAIDLDAREKELRKLPLRTLRIVEGSIYRGARSCLMVRATCSTCGKTWDLHVDNIRSGKTTGCRCQRLDWQHKYHDARAETLGGRYDAMVQRCERDTHVSSHNYKGRGIKVLFRNREHFVRWALETFPDTDFQNLDFDRIDNDGPYSPDNLRLSTRSDNLRNTRRAKIKIATRTP